MPKAKVISFVNMKGGVGKTTAAVNLAAYLARDHGKRVLLIDLDPQTNASLSLMSEQDWEKHAGEFGTMADIFQLDGHRKGDEEHFKFKACIVHDVLTQIPGLDLIPSHLKLTFLDLDLASRPGRERILSRKLEKVLDDYDLVLCDCPPNLQTATQNALFASDYYIVPMQPDFLSAIGLQLLVDRLAYLQEELEFKVKCLGVLFSRVRRHVAFHQETMDRLLHEKGSRKVRYFETIIPENVTLSEAPAAGLPIALYDGSATGAEAFKALATEVLGRL
ncbi:sporulation initiation inhibitor protein Soj [mine drainage metagenome]|uniref:Sporulation initiation inhibitor protein Soj n=1 Tax=mine drainage metagenome TaxID=410659 RepID=A0A1J5SI18_9ZZZZ